MQENQSKELKSCNDSPHNIFALLSCANLLEKWFRSTFSRIPAPLIMRIPYKWAIDAWGAKLDGLFTSPTGPAGIIITRGHEKNKSAGPIQKCPVNISN